jgi:hypothetical protein
MSTSVGSSAPSALPRFALPGNASDLAGQATAPAATRSAAPSAGAAPESTAARTTPLSRETFGIPVNPQAARLAQATAQPAGPAVSEKAVVQFQARNAKAVAALQSQLKELGQVQARIDALGSQSLTAPSQGRLAELSKAVAGKRQGIETELGLRETAAARIDQSTQAKGQLHQDTAVAQALGALADHAKGPGLTPKDVAGFNAVLDKKVHTEAKYDKPQYLNYGSQGGPGYPKREDADTRHSLGTSPAWADLTQAKQVTPSEQKVISRMSENEGGRTDALQGYDSEVVSLGAMQKTVNTKGTGELPRQIHEFSSAQPEKYKSLFADKGWTVEHTGKGTSNADYTLSFKDPSDPKAVKMTGTELKAYIHQKNHEAWNKTLSPLLAAGRDVDFQKKQILDYQSRLGDALGKVPDGKGKYTQPISAYVTSEQGAALVLDQDVNRPGYVATDFGKALDAFHGAHPQAPRDPARWTAAQRQQYEPAIAAQYEAARVGRMTDAESRAEHLTGPASGLSAAPGSFVRTP